MKISHFLILLLILITLPLVSAYNGYFSPSQLLENEWVIFSLIFLVFFAISFFALARTMKDNKGAALIVSAVVALFIAFAVSRRGFFYGYVGETIGNYLLVFALLLGAIILIKAITNIVGGIGLFIALGALWFVFSSLNPFDILPYELLNSRFMSFFNFLAGSGFLVLLIIALIVVVIAAYGGNKEINKSIRKWFWGKKKDEEIIIKR